MLAFSGFYGREDGKVGHADMATTLDAVRARAGRLKAALESRVVHADAAERPAGAVRRSDGFAAWKFAGAPSA